MTLQILREYASGKASKLEDLADDLGKDRFLSLIGGAHVNAQIVCTKGIVIISNDIAKAKGIKDEKKRLAMYKRILRNTKELRKQAEKIPSDKFMDIVWHAMKNPLSNALNVTKAVVVEKDVKNMTRNDVLDKIDALIKALEILIENLEDKSKSK